MSTRKRKTKSGISWAYYFDLPGSTRENRRTITESGFSTQKLAQDAETQRRIDERDLAEARARGVTATIPKTLAELLTEFCNEYAEKELAPKTVERYRQQAAYLSKELLAMPLPEVTALHLTREWNRLRESGGHHRTTGEVRPLSVKSGSVR